MERMNRVSGIVAKKQAQMVAKKFDISTEKVQELQDTFYVFDKNGDGMVTTEELASVLAKLGRRPSMREVQAMIRSVDSDKSGTIDFDEFVEIFVKKMSIDPEKELHEIFCVFDKNKDGFISPEELFNVLTKLGESITQEEAMLMIREADLDRDGKVNYSGHRFGLPMTTDTDLKGGHTSEAVQSLTNIESIELFQGNPQL